MLLHSNESGAMWLDDATLLRAAAFLAKASELDPKNVQNRARLARSYAAMGQFAKARKEALKVLEQVPDGGDAIIALTDAARSKEDYQAAEKQLQKFPDKNDVSFYLASANLFFRTGDMSAAGNALGKALTIDPKSAQAHTATGDLYLFRKIRNKPAKNSKRLLSLRLFVPWNA